MEILKNIPTQLPKLFLLQGGSLSSLARQGRPLFTFCWSKDNMCLFICLRWQALGPGVLFHWPLGFYLLPVLLVAPHLFCFYLPLLPFLHHLGHGLHNQFPHVLCASASPPLAIEEWRAFLPGLTPPTSDFPVGVRDKNWQWVTNWLAFRRPGYNILS